MTRDEIIKALNESICPDEELYLEPELEEAIENFSEPFQLVEPILRLIENNPSVYFGCPGSLVHFAEKFSGKGYEELLMQSVRRNPTEHNILMLHRCFNDPSDNRKSQYRALITDLKNSADISEDIRKAIDGFDWN